MYNVSPETVSWTISTRMHSSRMRTARGSSCQLGGVGSVSVHAGIHPPGCGPGDPPVLAWNPPPPVVGLETPPARPLNFPLWGSAWRHPLARPLKFPHGCGPGDQQGMLGYHPQRPARHAGIPPARHAGITPPL